MYPTEVHRRYQNSYVRNSRAIAVVWGMFTICFAILNIISFIQPQWLGSVGGTTTTTDQDGFFGLYRYCSRRTSNSEYSCSGDFTDFRNILSDPFKAASFFVGFSCLLFLFCILCFLLFFLLNTATVLNICGWIQIVAAICLFLGCVIYPSGWSNVEIVKVCKNDGRSFNAGSCRIRWAFILAIVLIFDAIILSVLAFLMAHKQRLLLPKIYEKKEANNAYGTDPYSERTLEQSRAEYSNKALDKQSNKY